jgi:MSHA biogenesis protein MshJ
MRERIMVFAAVMVALLALSYTLLIEPELIRQRRINAAMLQKHSEMKALDAQVTKLLGAPAQNRDRPERERLAGLRKELAEVEARIAAEERRFTAPAQMRGVIEEVLGRSRGLALVELKTLATTTLTDTAKPPAAAKPAAGGKPPAGTKAAGARGERLIYRHGLEVTVSGSYLDLLAYLRDLEALPTQLYWGALELDASAYPKLSMKLTVYTLSLDRAWLNV